MSANRRRISKAERARTIEYILCVVLILGVSAAMFGPLVIRAVFP